MYGQSVRQKPRLLHRGILARNAILPDFCDINSVIRSMPVARCKSKIDAALTKADV